MRILPLLALMVSLALTACDTTGPADKPIPDSKAQTFKLGSDQANEHLALIDSTAMMAMLEDELAKVGVSGTTVNDFRSAQQVFSQTAKSGSTVIVPAPLIDGFLELDAATGVFSFGYQLHVMQSRGNGQLFVERSKEIRFVFETENEVDRVEIQPLRDSRYARRAELMLTTSSGEPVDANIEFLAVVGRQANLQITYADLRPTLVQGEEYFFIAQAEYEDGGGLYRAEFAVSADTPARVPVKLTQQPLDQTKYFYPLEGLAPKLVPGLNYVAGFNSWFRQDGEWLRGTTGVFQTLTHDNSLTSAGSIIVPTTQPLQELEIDFFDLSNDESDYIGTLEFSGDEFGCRLIDRRPLGIERECFHGSLPSNFTVLQDSNIVMM